VKLKGLLALIFTSVGILILLLLGNALLSRQKDAELGEAELQKHYSYQLADELRQSSDDLTRMARTYAVTGNKKYEKFFNRVLRIRNGEVARPENYDQIYWDLVTGDEELGNSEQGEKHRLKAEC